MNVGNLLTDQYKRVPNRLAVSVPSGSAGKYHYKDYTFTDLEKSCNQYANAFKSFDIKRGMKVLLFVKPSFDFPAVTFALFKLGAIPIMIDPGMGLKNLLKCVLQVRPEAMVGIGATHIIRRIFSSSFKSIKVFINTSVFSPLTNSLKKIASTMPIHFETEVMNKDDLAAILFTSGGTGVPKGVEYTHRIFIEQTKMLQQMFQLSELDLDLPGFPLFALFTIGMGMCAVVPDMNPSRPATSNPLNLISHIKDKNITFVAGSPAIWEKVADYCLANDLILDSVRCLVMFGAPVRLDIHQKFATILPNGTTYTPYGATECLPVSCISGNEILAKYQDDFKNGKGVCVGLPAPGVKIIISNISDNEMKINDLIQKEANEVGEVVVLGPTVTPGYYEMPDKTNLAKIRDGDDLYHRMGDVGYLDNEGKLWFCGRKDHRIDLIDKTYYSIPVELFFNQVAGVKRSALVKVNVKNEDKLALVIEKNGDVNIQNLKDLAKLHNLPIDDFFFHKSFPVDVRHNIKIDRKKLWAYAQSKLN